MRLKNIIVIERIAAFVNVVKDVTALLDKVICGARAANTINPNASAPPKIPNRHNKSATGAIIREIAILIMVSIVSGTKNIKMTAIIPNPTHSQSVISLFQMSSMDAIDNIIIESIMRTVVMSDKISTIIMHNSGWSYLLMHIKPYLSLS